MEELALWDLLAAPDPERAWDDLLKEPPRLGRYFDGTPIWLVTRYGDVLAVLNDPRLTTELPADARAAIAAAVGVPPDMQPYFLRSLLTTDPPDHTRLRKLVSQAFTARRVERLQPMLVALADELIDKFADEEQVDLLDRYAYPFSSTAICELLGISASERDRWTGWAWVINDPTTGTPDEVAAATRGLLEYALRLIRQRGRTPGDDLVSALVHAHDQVNQLSDTELATMVLALMGGGAETTAYLVANGMYLLLTHPAQRRLLDQDPRVMSAAVEEMVRHSGPAVIGATLRFAAEPVPVGGVTIPAGAAVQVVLSAANRDPRQFDRPRRFDIQRRENAHVGFGHGIHFCLGAALARLETRIAISALLARFPRMALAVDPRELRWRPAGVRGPDRLPVTLSP